MILGKIFDLADGTMVSDCPLPCKTIQTKAKLLYEYKDVDTMIDITFSSKVKLTKTDLVKPTLSTFLSEVGLEKNLNNENFGIGGKIIKTKTLF